MRYYSIDAENYVIVHSTRRDARRTGGGWFSTAEQFADLIGPDDGRLVEIYNRLPGVRPVTKFASRKLAMERIFKVIQCLGGHPASRGVVEIILDGGGFDGFEYLN
jgi:hypothetical protein